MPHVAPPGLELPPGRYGTPRRAPRWLIALLAIAAAAIALPILISATDRATPDVRGVLTAYSIVSANEVEVTVDIHKPRDAVAQCTVEARNFYSDVVGSVEIELDEAVTSRALRRSFPTSDKAVVAEVTGCRQASDG